MMLKVDVPEIFDCLQNDMVQFYRWSIFNTLRKRNKALKEANVSIVAFPNYCCEDLPHRFDHMI